METKKCSKCGEVKELGEFGLDKRRKNGRRAACKKCCCRIQKDYEIRNPEVKKAYHDLNREKIRSMQKIRDANKTEEQKKMKVRRAKERYQEDPLFRLTQVVRVRARKALKGRKTSSCKYLGCTWEQLKNHLESQFTDGMTWDNMGEWHHDHIKPLATAKTTEDVIQLSHYTNLRPLWAEENQSRPHDGSDLTSPWPRNS